MIESDPLRLSLSAGIRQVERQEPLPPLPDVDLLPPADSRPALHLEELFGQPTAEESLVLACAPEIADRTLLEPATYAATLMLAHQALSTWAALAADPERQVMEAAVAVLDRAAEQRSLLDAARRALMRA